jgi:hypothetical protein
VQNTVVYVTRQAIIVLFSDLNIASINLQLCATVCLKKPGIVYQSVWCGAVWELIQLNKGICILFLNFNMRINAWSWSLSVGESNPIVLVRIPNVVRRRSGNRLGSFEIETSSCESRLVCTLRLYSWDASLCQCSVSFSAHTKIKQAFNEGLKTFSLIHTKNDTHTHW